MRLLPLSLACWGLALAGAAEAQSSGSSSLEIPFGQTIKDLHFPVYQNGQLSYLMSAVSAKGVTMNRAEAFTLKIEIYTNEKVTTTITSPDADIYTAERKMRTKNTVKIDRDDLTATSQDCDFDLVTAKYIMRDKVRVLLKHFDVGAGAKTPASAPGAPSPAAAPGLSQVAPPEPTPPPVPAEDTSTIVDPRVPHGTDPLLDMPGAVGTTNQSPMTPAPAPTP